MSHLTPELVELVAQFCDGEVREQAARFRGSVAESDDARRYLLQSFQIHSELAYDLVRESGDSRAMAPERWLPFPAVSRPSLVLNPRISSDAAPWIITATAIALLLAVTLGLSAILRRGGQKSQLAPGNESSPSSIARIDEAKDVRWSKDSTRAIRSPLPPGSKVSIDQGLVEVAFDSGARVLSKGRPKSSCCRPCWLTCGLAS